MSEQPGGATTLTRRDWQGIALCAVLALASILLIARYFSTAFPEASIDFRFDRSSSRRVAEELLRKQRVDVSGMKHAVRFDSDGMARVFLERSLGLEAANRVMRDDVRVWSWHHRWFRPLVEEEFSIDVAPTGEILAYAHRIPEDRAIAGALAPEPFLRSIGIDLAGLQLVEQSERRLPRRIQRIYTWESRTIRPAGAPLRHTVTIDGNVVTSYSQQLKVPDAWLRSYRELRSKNAAAGSVDLVFTIATMIAAVVFFVVRLRRGDMPLRFLLGIGAAAILLVGGMTLNSIPGEFAYYETTDSYGAFLGRLTFQSILQCAGTAMLLIVICGAGEVLYRQRNPQHLAMPRIWNRRALGSRRVFLSLILGYTLVPLFMAYQAVFYLVARRFGAWSPAEVPYDDMLNTALPWVAVLFAGFFPAFSEEFLSRAFSIPFYQRLLRWRFPAIVLAAFVWGFGHSTYAYQPFWIRGVEVGLAGIVAGLLMDRFGLLPLLIWHYTIDAVYTATLLFTSGNTYYVVSAAAASLIFAIPLVLSIAGYVRRGGFVPDDDLSNATLPIVPPPEPVVAQVEEAQLPEAKRVTPGRLFICAVLVIVTVLAIMRRPPSPNDAVDFRMTRERAMEIARAHVRGKTQKDFAHVIAIPVEGFRSWDRQSPREEGGAPGGFDGVAASHLRRTGMPVRDLTSVFRSQIEAGNWIVRFFSPMQKEEIFVEVDPRTARVIGYHKYQEEANRGASLSQPDALVIARSAFGSYGLDVNTFDLKEALSFQQPQRRDWLFHFDERVPLWKEAYRRVTVRVAGSEVTQFNKTIKIPDSVYREAGTQTLLNMILFWLQIIGVIVLLAAVITGLVVATRTQGLPWRRALRWTAVFSVIPIATFLQEYDTLLIGYNTTVAWETFRVNLFTTFVRDVGMKLGVLFVALAGLEASMPYVFSLPSAEGRRRFGRSALVAALTALSVLSLADVAREYAQVYFPSLASVSVSVPAAVALPLPSLLSAAQALFAAIILSAAVALYAQSVRKYTGTITMTLIFLLSLDPMATAAQTPFMLLRALAAAALVWLIARFVLHDNPLAWPAIIFLGGTLQTAFVLLRHHRPDLTANAIALIAFAVVAMAVLTVQRSKRPTQVGP